MLPRLAARASATPSAAVKAARGRRTTNLMLRHLSWKLYERVRLYENPNDRAHMWLDRIRGLPARSVLNAVPAFATRREASREGFGPANQP